MCQRCTYRGYSRQLWPITASQLFDEAISTDPDVFAPGGRMSITSVETAMAGRRRVGAAVQEADEFINRVRDQVWKDNGWVRRDA